MTSTSAHIYTRTLQRIATLLVSLMRQLPTGLTTNSYHTMARKFGHLHDVRALGCVTPGGKISLSAPSKNLPTLYSLRASGATT
mmetsp:Transcript_1381/g.2530  ORF Transcript_1381/g.2530 Transcript_1381/m.2530 type:complete len:84 (-) Transcript_1381:675-926(-)